MFCSKCGSQISSDDMYCPRCGASNSNYVEAKETSNTAGSKENLHVPKPSAISIPKKVIVGGIALCIVVAIIVAGVLNFNRIGWNMGLSKDKISYSPKGLSCYLDGDGYANFVVGSEILTLPVPVQEARTTPDHQKQIAVSKDGKLLLYSSEIKNGIEIDSDVESISAVNDECVYYTAGASGHLFVYDFTKEEVTDIGFENSELTFSSKKNTVVSINENGELSSFCRLNGQHQVLCNTEVDANIICVADDGSNLFWSINNGNTSSVYTMGNGAPEKIAELEDEYIFGNYYDNSKACIIYGDYCEQIILYKDNTPNMLVLPGKTAAVPVSANGESIDSDDDIVNDFYIYIDNGRNWMDFRKTLYRLSQDGNLTAIAEDVFIIGDLINNCVFYINTDNKSLYKKKIGDKGEGDKITTDVASFYVSPTGKYVYIIKAGGGLYCCDVSDKNYKLNPISSTFTREETLYITNKDNVIFYCHEDTDKPIDSACELYRYTVGEPTVKVVSNAHGSISLSDDDISAEYVDAEHPIIRIEKADDEQQKYEVGTLSDGTYITLLSGIEKIIY